MPIVRVTGNHQMTIPSAIRESLGVRIGDYVQVSLAKDGAVFKPVELVARKVKRTKKNAADDQDWAQLGEEEFLQRYDERDAAYDNIKL